MQEVTARPSTDRAAYRALVEALRARQLSDQQAEALCEILLHLHVAAQLLDEADAPGAPSFKQRDYYRLSAAESALDAFRHQLGALAATPAERVQR